MNIIENELCVKENGFNFGDDRDLVLLNIIEVIDCFSSDKNTVITKEVLFSGYWFISQFYFKDGGLQLIRLSPVFRKYYTPEEFRKRSSTACLKLAGDIIKELENTCEPVNCADENTLSGETAREYTFLSGEINIELFFNESFDEFIIELA
ncbi:MAG: hypothetical protein IJI83_03255 [Oscillospiraceae bacterium]|nr:hypothetical protein [Oscillospiraceae bacterium]